MNATPPLAGKVGDLSFREKLIREFYIKPYRKPTQADWLRILRHTGNGGSRNSAKKLSVSYRDALPRLWRGRSESLLTDCLAKTQVSANLNREGIEAETCPVLVSQKSK